MLDWITIPELSNYLKVIEETENRVNKIVTNEATEAVYLAEHEQVYTRGSSAKDEELIEPLNIPVYNTGRGGKFTYHGPGQRIIYPLLNLNKRGRDLRKYINLLEKTIILTLGDLGVNSFTTPDRVGVWVHNEYNDEKIASIGVRVKKWVTFHGAAVNISTDLEQFRGIIPCGLNNYNMTSLKKLGVNIAIEEFDYIYKKSFKKIFE